MNLEVEVSASWIADNPGRHGNEQCRAGPVAVPASLVLRINRSAGERLAGDSLEKSRTELVPQRKMGAGMLSR